MAAEAHSFVTERYDAEYLKAIEPMLPFLQAPPPATSPDIQQRREEAKVVFAGMAAAIPMPDDVESSTHYTVAADGAKLAIYEFRKQGLSDSPGPAILHCHGGGMIVGCVNDFKNAIARTVSETSVPVFSVEYRLAPESKDQALVEDCYAGLLWLHEKAESLRIDPKRIGVMGESAGGGLAAGVALMARDKKLQPPLAKQFLIYPMLDDRNTNFNEAIDAYTIWRNSDNIFGWNALLGDKAGKPDATVSHYAAPARARDVANLPSTYIDVGGLDLFRDEDLLYASRIAAENIDLEFHLYPGMPHGFEAIAPGVSVSQHARVNRVAAIKKL